MSETKIKIENNPENVRSILEEIGINTVSLNDEQLKNKLQKFFSDAPPENSQETAIDLAYKVSTDYMDTAISRFDKMDEKIQTIFTFSIGVFAIAPTLLKTNSADKINIFFWAGIGLLILAGVISVIARVSGELTIANPEKIYTSKGFEAHPDVFKKSIIKVAADAYRENSKVLETKHRLNIVSMAMFGIALASLTFWLVRFAL